MKIINIQRWAQFLFNNAHKVYIHIIRIYRVVLHKETLNSKHDKKDLNFSFSEAPCPIRTSEPCNTGHFNTQRCRIIFPPEPQYWDIAVLLFFFFFLSESLCLSKYFNKWNFHEVWALDLQILLTNI